MNGPRLLATLTDKQQQVLDVLHAGHPEGRTLNELAEATGLPPSVVGSALSRGEQLGLVRHTPAGWTVSRRGLLVRERPGSPDA